MVSNAERDDAIRIISARKATRPIVRFMKKAKKPTTGELRPEYTRSDFGTLVRGKYVDRLRESSNIVVLDPDVADLFPNAAAVNAALRALADIVNRANVSRRD